MRPRTRATVVQAMFIGALCLVAYGNAMGNAFLLDDFLFLSEKGLGSASWPDLLLTARLEHWRPVAMAALKAFYLLFGNDPLGYHLANLAVFVAVCVLFAAIGSRLFMGQPGRDATTLAAVSLFAVHPINNVLVNQGTAVSLAVAVILMQLCLLSFLSYSRSGGTLSYWSSVGFFGLALLSHEVCYALPPALWAVHWTISGKSPARAAVAILPHLAAVLLVAALRCRLAVSGVDLRPIALSTGLPLLVRLSTLESLLRWYLLKLAVPVDLVFIWDVPIRARGAVGGSLAVLAEVAVFGGALWLLLLKRLRTEALCLAMFAVGLLPLWVGAFTYSRISGTGTAIIEPQWFYFHSFGLFLLAGRALALIGRRLPPVARAAAFGSALLVLALLTRRSNEPFKDETTYAKHWLSLNPHNRTAYAAAWKALPPEQAVLASFAVDVTRAGYFAVLLGEPGGCRAAIGSPRDVGEAADRLAEALRLAPASAAAHYDMGVLLARCGRIEPARRYLKIARGIDPGHREARRLFDQLSRP